MIVNKPLMVPGIKLPNHYPHHHPRHCLVARLYPVCHLHLYDVRHLHHHLHCH